MKHLILIATATAALSTTALAADMRARMPLKAPPAAVAVYNWTGFYVGGHVGSAFSRAPAVTTVTATGAFSSAGNSNDSTFLGGGQIGYNWQFSPNWVLGIEADISATDINNGYTGIAGATTAGYRQDIDLFGTVRGRLGYAWNNVLLYATGGYAWADTDFRRTQIAGITVAAIPGTVETIGRTLSGYTVGGGLEYGFSPNWSAKLEYNYIDLGNRSAAFPISARTTAFDTEIHAVKFGINYRFGGGW